MKKQIDESELNDLLFCPQCGSGDVKLCSISVRPYCNECKYWGRINLNGTMQDAIKDWNESHATLFAVIETAY